MTETHDFDVLEMTVGVVSSFVTNNAITPAALPDLIRSVHQTILSLSTGQAVAVESLSPAVSVARSITPEYLVCLEDGRKLKMLKRYLRSRYDMTPEEYRDRWGLPADYPMVAPNYARLRSQHAKDIGLGRKKK